MSATTSPLRAYLAFLGTAFRLATEGPLRYFAWMTVLSAIALVGANAWAEQVAQGMTVTGMSDHVSWGLYIANFTFLVGLAAAAVMMVIPAYVYHDHEMHDVTIIGELLAIAAIIMCLLFVTADLGRPERFWHLIPGLGRFNFPMSLLTWDVIVLNGYLLLNLHICGYLLYTRFRGRIPDPRWFKPFVYLSIIWAFSIHTVTAFLYCGLGGRPFWNSAVLGPRFLASAFVAGPAFIILALQVVRHYGYPLGQRPIELLLKVVRVTCLINLFLFGCEIFTVLYTGSSHLAALQYLLVGLHGKHGLVPWIWSAIVMNVIAAVLFLLPAARSRAWVLNTACVLTFVAIWIEKGMGLIIPGFVPSTLHEIVEYVPSLAEWKITAGIWAFGLLVYTVALKVAVPILAGKVRAGDAVVDQPPTASAALHAP